ncbi:MAG: serine/threonine protein kinase [Deltaproteobacteria bacterium]|nr:serine/threonine protein kinase [Deltaproteobacteria bacterium]MBN2674172.1 serine/threonine protein kinase [Deltaproteobacteria bacterium]
MSNYLFNIQEQPEAGHTFESGSRYELICRLGKGGMGEVWRARRHSAAGHVQNVAVKFMSEPGVDVNTLDAEALRMSNLIHDNIVPFIDSGQDSAGRYFVAMQLIEGFDLNALRDLAYSNVVDSTEGQEMARIPDKIVGFIIFMTLRALAYAHSRDFGGGARGLIHRDISPGNILLDEREGFVKLTDFGVAAVQGSDANMCQITGKIPYMAPEVLIEDPINCQVDIYSLGLVAYELLTGFNPNIRATAMESVLGAISEVMLSLEKPLRPPHEVIVGVDEGLSQIIVSMLEKGTEHRYKNAEAVMMDLGVFLFERGYGPTTGSLADYLWLLKNGVHEAPAAMKQRLRFLKWHEESDPIRPAYQLTPLAQEDFFEGRNPGRVHS